MADGIKKHFPKAEIVSIPVVCGGEGSVDCFLTALGGSCTNDFGCGAACACGVKFFDKGDRILVYINFLSPFTFFKLCLFISI